MKMGCLDFNPNVETLNDPEGRFDLPDHFVVFLAFNNSAKDPQWKCCLS